MVVEGATNDKFFGEITNLTYESWSICYIWHQWVYIMSTKGDLKVLNYWVLLNFLHFLFG